MNCPTCDVPLMFIEEGYYRTQSNKKCVGRYYECPRCSAEFLRRSGGTWKRLTEGVVEVCELIQTKEVL